MRKRDLVAHLKKHGCEIAREGRRHEVWCNPANGRESTVARHTEIPNPTARGIAKQLGIPRPSGI